MNLLNFDLAKPSFAQELVGLNQIWDLHNLGDFLGVTFSAFDDKASMFWKYPGNGCFLECKITFQGVNTFVITPRDKELPYTEDLCVSAISKILPEAIPANAPRWKSDWSANDPFNLLFQFQSGRSIEIDAETAELSSLELDATSSPRVLEQNLKP